MNDDRLTEEEYQQIKARVEKEWPIRCQLATLAGFKANAKNPRCLFETEFDLSIGDLYLKILFKKPDNADAALQLIRGFYS